MTYTEYDPATQEADRWQSHFVQQGIDPSVVAAVLPALVSDDAATSQRAQQWLAGKTYGVGPVDDEGVADRARLISEARAFVRSCGDNAPERVGFTQRYDASQSAMATKWGTPDNHYPDADGNAAVLRAAAEREATGRDAGPARLKNGNDLRVRDTAPTREANFARRSTAPYVDLSVPDDGDQAHGRDGGVYVTYREPYISEEF